MMCHVAQDMLFTGPQAQPPLPEASGGDKYVALVSGLSVGDEAGEPARVALLVDYLAGLLGSPPEQEQVAKVHCSAATMLVPQQNASLHIPFSVSCMV